MNNQLMAEFLLPLLSAIIVFVCTGLLLTKFYPKFWIVVLLFCIFLPTMIIGIWSKSSSLFYGGLTGLVSMFLLMMEIDCDNGGDGEDPELPEPPEPDPLAKQLDNSMPVYRGQNRIASYFPTPAELALRN